jgi:hypothetical protein
VERCSPSAESAALNFSLGQRPRLKLQITLALKARIKIGVLFGIVPPALPMKRAFSAFVLVLRDSWGVCPRLIDVAAPLALKKDVKRLGVRNGPLQDAAFRGCD